MQRHPLFETDILLIHNATDKDQSVRFARLSFTVKDWCCNLFLRINHFCQEQAQLPICLFDPNGDIRIMRASEGSAGYVSRSFHLGIDQASEGGIPGELPAGEWKLLVYKRRFFENIAMKICVEAEIADPLCTEDMQRFNQRNIDVQDLEQNPFSRFEKPGSNGGGWYSGELHVHSSESTGRTSMEDILQAAKEQKLDFIAVTDHFTASHWLKIQGLHHKGSPLFLQSMEVSGDYGHINIHGIQKWINPLVDDNEDLVDFLGLSERTSMESIADEVHAQQGLVSINHAQSGMVAWRYFDFPLEKADLFEIWCLPDSAVTLLYPTMWDNLLCQGYHLTGVGSSDSHHPYLEGAWKLGQIRTWVYADSLSQFAIIQGLKKGRAFVSYGMATLEFSARTCKEVFYMGDTMKLQEGEHIELDITLYDHTSGNLFIFSNGMLYDLQYLNAADKDSLCIIVDPARLPKIKTGTSYIRLEFHEDIEKSRFWGMAYRDHTSMRILSNPIWINISMKEIP